MCARQPGVIRLDQTRGPAIDSLYEERFYSEVSHKGLLSCGQGGNPSRLFLRPRAPVALVTSSSCARRVSATALRWTLLSPRC